MDIIDIKLANKFATQVAAGFSKVEVDGMNINFTLNDGTKTTLTVPEPDAGVSVVNLEINNNKHLICTMSDDSTIDAGEVPFIVPEKGIDYWTNEDKAEIAEYVDNITSNAFTAEIDDSSYTLLLKRVGSQYHDQMRDISNSLDDILGEEI